MVPYYDVIYEGQNLLLFRRASAQLLRDRAQHSTYNVQYYFPTKYKTFIFIVLGLSLVPNDFRLVVFHNPGSEIDSKNLHFANNVAHLGRLNETVG